MRQGYAIFCDDIRPEVSGKRTLVGVFGNKLIFPAGSHPIPKFCIEGHVLTEIDNRFKALNFIVEFPDREPITLNAEKVDSLELDKPDDDVELLGPASYQHVGFQIEIGNFIPEKSGIIVVKAVTESETILLARLAVAVRHPTKNEEGIAS